MRVGEAGELFAHRSAVMGGLEATRIDDGHAEAEETMASTKDLVQPAALSSEVESQVSHQPESAPSTTAEDHSLQQVTHSADAAAGKGGEDAMSAEGFMPARSARPRSRSAKAKARQLPPPLGEEELRAAIIASAGQDEKIEDVRRISGLERAALRTQVTQLSTACFNEDTITKFEHQEDWRLLCCHQGARLIGFAVYRRMLAPLRLIVLVRLAVVPSARCQGYGRQLVSWLLRFASQLPSAECNKMGTSALSDAVGFYRRLGFVEGVQKSGQVLNAGEEDCERVQGGAETWMEIRVTHGRSQKKEH